MDVRRLKVKEMAAVKNKKNMNRVCGQNVECQVVKIAVRSLFHIFPTRCKFYTIYLYLENCSTCFGWYLHPSSGAHINVLTVSGTC